MPDSPARTKMNPPETEKGNHNYSGMLISMIPNEKAFDLLHLPSLQFSLVFFKTYRKVELSDATVPNAEGPV